MLTHNPFEIRFGWSSCTIQLERLVYQCLDTHLIYTFWMSKLWWETTFPLFDFESVMKDVHFLSKGCGSTHYNDAVGFWITSLPWTRLLLNLKGLWLAFKLNRSELSLACCTGYLAALGICISDMSTLSWSKSLQSCWVRLACNVTKILKPYTAWYLSPSIHLKENLISCPQLEGHIDCLASVAKFEWQTCVILFLQSWQEVAFVLLNQNYLLCLLLR